MFISSFLWLNLTGKYNQTGATASQENMGFSFPTKFWMFLCTVVASQEIIKQTSIQVQIFITMNLNMNNNNNNVHLEGIMII